MARICPLFSSSSGNSTYISCGSSGILIDAGASFKALNGAIEGAFGDLNEIRAVAVTHEHIDHIKGLKVFLKNTGVPLIASSDTVDCLKNKEIIPPDTHIYIADKEEICLGDMVINRFATSHDCKGSSGYVITLSDHKKIGVCTDLGIITNEVLDALKHCDCVLIESNHDIEMLKKGPYPPDLKLRILSDKGHLSNNMCATQLPELLRWGTTRFILGHLSENNNTPLHARLASKNMLEAAGAKEDEDYILTVAKPKNNGVTVL